VFYIQVFELSTFETQIKVKEKLYDVASLSRCCCICLFWFINQKFCNPQNGLWYCSSELNVFKQHVLTNSPKSFWISYFQNIKNVLLLKLRLKSRKNFTTLRLFLGMLFEWCICIFWFGLFKSCNPQNGLWYCSSELNVFKQHLPNQLTQKFLI
jgi:hypothetical protein